MSVNKGGPLEPREAMAGADAHLTAGKGLEWLESLFGEVGLCDGLYRLELRRDLLCRPFLIVKCGSRGFPEGH